MTESELSAVVQRIQARIKNFQVEGACWPWMGSKTGSGPRLKMRRNRAFQPSMSPYMRPPYGTVKIAGKIHQAHRLIYAWATPEVRKSDTFRLVNQCRNTLCCNPAHWLLFDAHLAPLGPPGHTTEEGLGDIVWNSTPSEEELRRDCEELLESMLAVNQPRTFEEVKSHVYMVDFQPQLIKEVLRAIGKAHLAD